MQIIAYFKNKFPELLYLILSEIIKNICGITLSSDSSKCQAFNRADVKTRDSCGPSWIIVSVLLLEGFLTLGCVVFSSHKLHIISTLKIFSAVFF